MSANGETSGSSLSVVLFDEHRLARDSMAECLQCIDPNLVVATCGDFTGTPDLASSNVVVINMDGREAGASDRWDLIDRVRQAAPEAAILVLSRRCNLQDLSQVLSRGGSGLMHCESSLRLLVAAIRLISCGGVFVSKEVLSEALKSLRDPSVADPAAFPTGS